MLLSLFSVSSSWSADARKELQGVTKEIREKKQLIDKTTLQENRVSAELRKIDDNLREKQATLVALKRDMLKVENGIEKTSDEISIVQGEAEAKKLLIQKRLVSIYKAGDTGSIRFLFSSDSFPQMLENMRYMKSLLESDRKLVSAYEERIAKLKFLKNSMVSDIRKKERLGADIESTKRQIEVEKQSKSSFLVRVREEKKAYQASLRELEANSRRLQSIVARLEVERKRKEFALRRAEAARQKKILQARAAAARQQSKTRYREKVKESHGNRTDVTAPAISPPESTSGFASQKGRLSMPARGRIVSSFGRHKHPEFNSFTVSNGISIAAPSGTEVRSVYEGKVVFSDYFKGYGNMVIVDHGGGFFSLYAHNSRLLKRSGASVSRNEVLANVGDVDSAKGSVLYFEIRYQGKPVDPSSWVR
jgi:septal ring factor EnvC (AmiA/AmiB activator)